MVIIWILLLLIKIYSCENIDELFKEINEITVKFNAIGADIAWRSSINPADPSLPIKAAVYQQKKIAWQHNECKRLGKLYDKHVLNLTEERQAYLLCRGPSYTYDEARKLSDLNEELQSIYTKAAVCIPYTESTTKYNITVLEDAIIKYIDNVQLYLKSNEDSIHFAAKIAAKNFEKDGMCLKGEENFETVMKNSRKPEVLEWVWLVWREMMRPMKVVYKKLVDVENKAARRNGYTDIGASWRNDLEIPNLREISRRLHNDIKPLYELLHGIVRFSLRRRYGDAVPERGPIPAHLLGNLWSQTWEPLANLILPNVINLDDRMKKLNWTVKDMIKRAEDFYISLGLPPMTTKFWRESIFSRENHSLANCHGTAADMFKDGDIRLLYCSGVSFDDFYVIHHELGHLQYYMAYENQPGLFRQANAALHETVGDTIMYAVMTPQHLHRLRLINDSELYKNEDFNNVSKTKLFENYPTDVKNLNYNKFNDKIDNDEITVEDINKQYINRFIKKNEFNIKPNEIDIGDFVRKYVDRFKDNDDKSDEFNIKYFGDLDKVTTDEILLLKQALNKLPQIPFSLLIDEYRWRYFDGSLDYESMNEEFWAMALDFQGIAPGNLRGEEYFDIGAKYHVSDNTPYIRYFLSSFLQHQLFESLCSAAVLGHRNLKEPLPSSIRLNRCDIYGSKSAGRLLKDLMSRGHSQHWRQIIQETLSINDISASALKRYYRPLYKLLVKLVAKYNIPIGW